MTAIFATLHFCSGAKAKHRVMELSGIKAGVQTMYASQKRDIQRVKKVEKDHQSYSKEKDKLQRGLL